MRSNINLIIIRKFACVASDVGDGMWKVASSDLDCLIGIGKQRTLVQKGHG